MHPTQNLPTEICVTPADLLRGAALYIERHGWIQDTYYAATYLDGDPTPSACAAGALGMAAFGQILCDPHAAYDRIGFAEFINAETAFNEYLDWTVLGHPSGDNETDWQVHQWNDAPGRTAAEVITALRHAANDYDRLAVGAS